MTLEITGLYGAVLALLLLILRTRVTIHRAKSGISILHRDDLALAEKIRIHGNFIENVPHVLILMGIIELAGAPLWVMHISGGALVLSRLLHPLGLKHDTAAHPIRIASGMVGMLALIIPTLYIFWGIFS